MREDSFRFHSCVLGIWLSSSETRYKGIYFTDEDTGSEILLICSKPRLKEALITVVFHQPECCWWARGTEDTHVPSCGAFTMML